MELKPCASCGAQVSRSALACPKCGRNLAAYRSHWWALAIAAAMLFAVVVTLSESAQAQQVYRCTDASGHTTFSQQACPNGLAGDEVRVIDTSPNKGDDYVPWGDVSSPPAPAERKASRVTVIGSQKKCSDASEQRVRTAIVQNKVFAGMTVEQATRSWGKPIKINRSSHGSDQWVYHGTYLYIEDGCVVSWN